MRALVLDGHSRAALACTQSLGRAGVEVHVASESGEVLARHSRFARVHRQQPPASDPERFLAWLRALDEDGRFTVVIPCTENSLIPMRALGPNESLRARAVLPSDDALDTSLDKHRTRLLASSLEVPVPESVLITSWNDVLPPRAFPVVLKPGRSKVVCEGRLVTLGATVARQEAKRRATLESWLPLTSVEEQEFVPGQGVGLGFLYDQGRPVWHFAWRRVHEVPLTGGASTYRRSVAPPDELLTVARRLLDALRWHGVAMVEFRVTADRRFYLMEINPRLWGSLALAISSGVNFPLGLLALARGSSAGPQPRYRTDVHARSLPEDVDWFIQNLRADHSDRLLLTVSPLRALRDPLRLFVGREVWDHFTLQDPGVGLAIIRRVMANLSRSVASRLRTRKQLWRLAWGHRRRNLARLAAEPSRLLFLCQGNICRSPVAAALAEKLLPTHHIESAGFHPREGRGTPPHVRDAARSMGLDLELHESRRVTAQQVARADLILLMDLENYETLRREFPDAAPKATLLGLFAVGPARAAIPDPLVASADETRRVLGQIERSVLGLRRALGVSVAAAEGRARGPHTSRT